MTKSATYSADAQLEPSVERKQHGRVVRVGQQIVDARGLIGRPFMAEPLLAQLERHGAIGPRERAAGEEFQRLFQLAHLDPLRAADMERIGGADFGGPNRIEWARGRINTALDALGGQGSPCGTCAWFILGCELSLRDWARREGWSGRPINGQVAKGTLLGALGVLVQHFGY